MEEGRGGAYLKNRGQIIKLESYAMQVPKTQGAGCPTYGVAKIETTFKVLSQSEGEKVVKKQKNNLLELHYQSDSTEICRMFFCTNIVLNQTDWCFVDRQFEGIDLFNYQ